MTIEEKQESFIMDFNELNDWFMQYEYLIVLAGTMEELQETEKNEETRVSGCQSNVWVIVEYDGQKLKIRADSDSLIIKGILGIIVQLLDGNTPYEILKADICFIERTSLKQQLSTDRFKGMSAVIDRIRSCASIC